MTFSSGCSMPIKVNVYCIRVCRTWNEWHKSQRRHLAPNENDNQLIGIALSKSQLNAFLSIFPSYFCFLCEPRLNFSRKSARRNVAREKKARRKMKMCTYRVSETYNIPLANVCEQREQRQQQLNRTQLAEQRCHQTFQKPITTAHEKRIRSNDRCEIESLASFVLTRDKHCTNVVKTFVSQTNLKVVDFYGIFRIKRKCCFLFAPFSVRKLLSLFISSCHGNNDNIQSIPKLTQHIESGTANAVKFLSIPFLVLRRFDLRC